MIPCIIFSKLVYGDLNQIVSTIDFSNDALFADPYCSCCIIKNMCKTCYGMNLKDRGELYDRDKTSCLMSKIEVEATCIYQMKYLKDIKDRELSKDEINTIETAAYFLKKVSNDIDLYLE